jgi:uncharacterized membrane protein
MCTVNIVVALFMWAYMHNIIVICTLLPFIVSAYTVLLVRIYVQYKCIYLGWIVSIPYCIHVNANISTKYITLMFPTIIYKANVSTKKTK